LTSLNDKVAKKDKIMKKIILLALVLIGCKGKDYVCIDLKGDCNSETIIEKTNEKTIIEQGPPKQIVLVASKSYGPSVFNNATYQSKHTLDFAIPSKVKVIEGNAGNHTLYLDIGSVRCTYQGGASVSKPLSPYNATQVVLGQWYNFQSCTDSSTSGTQVRIYSGTVLNLEVNNGDTTQTTKVELVLEIL
jgi:hypothetical protein